MHLPPKPKQIDLHRSTLFSSIVPPTTLRLLTDPLRNLHIYRYTHPTPLYCLPTFQERSFKHRRYDTALSFPTRKLRSTQAPTLRAHTSRPSVFPPVLSKPPARPVPPKASLSMSPIHTCRIFRSCRKSQRSTHRMHPPLPNTHTHTCPTQ